VDEGSLFRKHCSILRSGYGISMLLGSERIQTMSTFCGAAISVSYFNKLCMSNEATELTRSLAEITHQSIHT
jgi:hypothetical protein